MENQDKIFERFKEIATDAESKEFHAMEKVWSRVEDKLDYKAAKKSLGLWKTIAIAASILLLATIGYQFFASETTTTTPATKNQIATTPEEIPGNGQSTEPTSVDEKTTIAIKTAAPIAAESNRVIDKADAGNATAIETDRAVAVEDDPPGIEPIGVEMPTAAPNFQTITGFVSDDAGFLPGANVVVMGTTRGTQTGIDGKYSIEAKEGEKLVFSFVGMKDIVTTVGSQSQINAKLPDGNVLLESVVATGYRAKDKNQPKPESKGFTTKKAKSRSYKATTGTRLQEGNAETENAISANVEFATNAPTLYIIDGVPASEAQFKQLKTDEIASMKLLSQSEATTLYGKKAVNGAMVVSKKAAKKDIAASADDAELFENAFESPAVAPLSTFKLKVETNAYAEIRNFINKGQKVPKEIVRIEEMINYFEYRYPQPEDQNPVSINTEYGTCPWNSKHKLLKVGVQGKNIATTIVKDAKIQIEFNPAIVKGYRLIGYEKRMLRPEDFKASQPGSLSGGHTVTALYEVIPNGVDSQYFDEHDEAEFTKINTGTTFGGELANIKFRYEKTDGGKSAEIVKPIANQPQMLQNTSGDFRFCAAVAWFGLRLRESEFVGNRSKADLLKVLKSSLSADSEGARMEFLRLVEAVK